jgi:hypothetical protein
MAQRDAAWVRSATPDEVFTAHEAGELVDLIDTRNSPAVEPVEQAIRDGQKNMAWVKAARPDQVEAARDAGQLDDLLGVERNQAGNTVEDLR